MVHYRDLSFHDQADDKEPLKTGQQILAGARKKDRVNGQLAKRTGHDI